MATRRLDGRLGDTRERGNPLHTAGGGQVFGLVSERQAESVISALLDGDTPGPNLPDVPWAAAVVRSDGSIAATCSTMLSSGILLDRNPASPGTWVMGLNVRDVVCRAPWRHDFDKQWLRSFVEGNADPCGSPFTTVTRVLPGQTVVLRGTSAPRVVTWCGPEAWPAQPDVEGPLVPQEYLDRFDQAVDSLAQVCGPLSLQLSGGLDSTFVAASLAHRPTADRTRAYVAVPLPEARAPRDGWIYDDGPSAQLMAARYPTRLEVEEVRNEAMTLPLDAAAEQVSETWWPTFAVANLVWVRQIDELALHRGSAGIFTGSNGNAAFSHSHAYAARFLLNRRNWRGLWRLVSPENALPRETPRLVKRRIVGPLRSSQDIGFGTRAAYLRWLAGHENPYAPARSPVVGRPLAVDPFSSRLILDYAARMTPVEWHRSALGRGYARMLGTGRVPDAIRLRVGRGRQAGDVWFWIHRSRERYFDELRHIASTPIADEVLDAQGLERIAQSWAWGDPSVPPPKQEITTIDRALAFAAYCREMTARLNQLNRKLVARR